MTYGSFDGQQADEKILFAIRAHPLSKYLAIAKIIVLAIFFAVVLFLIAPVVPLIDNFVRAAGIIISLLLAIGGIIWNHLVYDQDVAYITDRRIVRFDIVSPFFKTKRALFWNEALKTKAYAPNLLYRYLGVGVLTVEPQLAEEEDVTIRDVAYFEDLANYIDKILFTFKNKPEEMASLKPFVPKPRGEHG